MEHALVVVDSNEKVTELVTEASELAMGVDASLTLLHVTSESDYEQDRKAMEGVVGAEDVSYDVERAAEGARQFARDLGEELLGADTDFEPLGAVGSTAEEVLRTARDEGCDHIFVAGRRRSPSGKAIFGDTAQRVILNFGGPVTVMTGTQD